MNGIVKQIITAGLVAALVSVATLASVARLASQPLVIDPLAPPEGAGTLGLIRSAGCYRQAGGDKIVCQSGGEIEIQSGATFDLQSGATSTLDSDLSLGGEVDLDGTDFLNLTPATTQEMSAGSALTPVGTFQPITSSGAVALSTTTSIVTTGAETGDLLILKNDNALDAITIDGTGGTVECKANVILGAQDTLWLVYNGTDWVCLSGYDNS